MTSATGSAHASKRVPLSRERILATATALIAEDGATKFSRSVAERLGVTPMALYKWFDNREHLLDALTAQSIDEPAPPLVLHGSWDDRALQLASAIRDRLLGHLALLSMEGASRRLAPTILGYADAGLELMVELGYDGQAAVDAYRVLFWSAIDYCLVIDATDAMPRSESAGWIVDQLAEVGEDPARSMPTLARFLPNFSAVDRDAFFRTTITTIAAGLRAQSPLG